MIVAVIAMGMMQTPLMVAMGHGFMPATRTVHMIMAMAERVAADRGAGAGIGVADLYDMLVHMVLVRVVKMAVMEIVHVIAMLDGGVAAARPMDVIVIGVFGRITGHRASLL